VDLLELTELIPTKQYNRRNSIATTLGYDKLGIVDYRFDPMGFRTDALDQATDLDQYELFVFGCSISVGVGVEYQNTYSSLLGKNFKVKNMGFADCKYDNTIIYNLANHVLTRLQKIAVVHWISRSRDDANYEIYNSDLKSKSSRYFSLAHDQYSTEKLKTIDMYNFPYLDLCEYSQLDDTIPKHPGPLTHEFFYKCINHSLTR
jgi:hypothetical protein